MSGRVVSSPEARDAVQRFQQIVSGPLLDQINALNTQGTILSQPANWDGRLAADFRSRWPDTHRQLLAMKASLEELRQQVDTITRNIMEAGGN